MPILHADRADTFYREWGQGPAAVLLLHAGASSSVQWERLGAALAAAGPRVVAPDLYGHGRTPCPADMTPETLLERQVAVLRALLHAPGAPVRLIGHSYGAVLGLRLALDHPELVRDLVLIEPVAFGLLDADDPALAPIEAIEADCRARVLAGDADGATRRFLEFWSLPDLWDFLPEAEQAAIVAGARERHFIGGPAVFAARFAPDALAALDRPARLVTGDDGPAAPRIVAERLAAALPNAERITISGAGHMLPLTHHRPFLRLLSVRP